MAASVAGYGFCIVEGTPATVEASEQLIRRVGYIRETIFGGFWDFQADLSKADTAYTNLELLPHTDGTYSHDVPGLQLLHCLAFDGTGGESTMVDGFRIAERAAHAMSPATTTCSRRWPSPGSTSATVRTSIAARPVFRHDDTGALVQVSFNNADRAPFLLPADEMNRFYDATRAFEASPTTTGCNGVACCRPGSAMLFDNWRVLHGRTSYTGHRHLCGGYVNREDFESRLRLSLAAVTSRRCCDVSEPLAVTPRRVTAKPTNGSWRARARARAGARCDEVSGSRNSDDPLSVAPRPTPPRTRRPRAVAAARPDTGPRMCRNCPRHVAITDHSQADTATAAVAPPRSCCNSRGR